MQRTPLCKNWADPFKLDVAFLLAKYYGMIQRILDMSDQHLPAPEVNPDQKINQWEDVKQF